MIRASILVVDDHPIFAKGLSDLLESQAGYTILGTAKNCTEALEILQAKRPDLAIVDLTLGDEDGLTLIKEMKEIYADLKILVLSMHEERYYAERALRKGARGYIMKEEAISNIFEAIKTILAGKIWLSVSERERLFESMSTGDFLQKKEAGFATVNSLSTRQLQIFKMIGKGGGTAFIAEKLNLSPKTVDTHKEQIKLKLHCATAQELRQFAIEWVNN
ncbi:MAG TPA: response regulator transcription factor [Treponemataceae bacterium]|nr:response regulator transcription factor [Treponemataceae bacterium]